MRSSSYLYQKIENLSGTIKFFEQNAHARILFLSQIDFWSWEVDELIFSVSNFEERKKDWLTDPQVLLDKLVEEGYCIDLSDNVSSMLRYMKGSAEYRNYDTPWADLEVLIDKWNDLLRLVELALFNPKKVKMIVESGGLAKSIESYRKSMPNK